MIEQRWKKLKEQGISLWFSQTCDIISVLLITTNWVSLSLLDNREL